MTQRGRLEAARETVDRLREATGAAEALAAALWQLALACHAEGRRDARACCEPLGETALEGAEGTGSGRARVEETHDERGLAQLQASDPVDRGEPHPAHGVVGLEPGRSHVEAARVGQ